jgi:hypothetical protein
MAILTHSEGVDRDVGTGALDDPTRRTDRTRGSTLQGPGDQVEQRHDAETSIEKFDHLLDSKAAALASHGEFGHCKLY